MTTAPPRADPYRPPPTSQPPPHQRTWWWLIIGGGLACMCLCGGMCVVTMGAGVYQALAERDDVELVLTGFLREMDAKQFDRALKRFSSRAARTGAVSREQLVKMANEPQFQGGQTAHVTNISIGRAINSNQNVPQGTVANVVGSISYENGSSAPYQATLEKEQGSWRLHALQIQGPTASTMPKPK